MTIFVLLSLAIVVGAPWLAWNRRRPPSEPSGRSDHQRRAPQRESYSYEEALPRITSICDALHRDSRAKAVLVIDNHGRAVGQAGDNQPLTARNVASWAPQLGGVGAAARPEGPRGAHDRARWDDHEHRERGAPAAGVPRDHRRRSQESLQTLADHRSLRCHAHPIREPADTRALTLRGQPGTCRPAIPERAAPGSRDPSP
jgi:hypothetical protein